MRNPVAVQEREFRGVAIKSAENLSLTRYTIHMRNIKHTQLQMIYQTMPNLIPLCFLWSLEVRRSPFIAYLVYYQIS